MKNQAKGVFASNDVSSEDINEAYKLSEELIIEIKKDRALAREEDELNAQISDDAINKMNEEENPLE